MTVQSDLKTALEIYINSNFSGELAAVSAEQLNLERLLKILESVTPVTLSGDVTIDNVAITSSALPDGAATEVTLATLALENGGNLADLVLALGEIQASPTANTVLARLKAIADALAFNVKTAANSLSTTVAQDQTTLAQLTAPSSTTSVSMSGYTRAFITLTIASINTNVVVRIEGSNDGSSWTNLSTANTDTTITANGTYGFVFVGCPASVRVTFVSESGGTAATIDAIVRVSA